jgi:hypothetical protein
VRVAISPRRSWRREATPGGASVFPGHPSARAPDDLPDVLSRQVKVDADARELFAGLVAAQ